MKKEFVNKKIGFFGASITDNGYYLYHVRSHILNQQEKCMVFNHGVGGTRAEMGIHTIKDELEPIYPDYMVVEFGANDLGIWLYDSFLIQNQELELSKKQRNDTYKENMVKIADYLVEKGIKPIFMTPFAVDELLIETDDIETLVDNKEKGEKITPAFYKRSTFARINNALKEYGDWIKEMCAQRGFPVIDVFSYTYKQTIEKGGLHEKDGIHYSFEGASAIADVVLEFLGYQKPFVYERTEINNAYWEEEKKERSAQFLPWNFCHPIFGNFTKQDILDKAQEILANEKSSELNKRRANGYINYYEKRHELRKELHAIQEQWLKSK